MRQARTALIIALVLTAAALAGVFLAGSSPADLARAQSFPTPGPFTNPLEHICIECYGQSRYVFGSGIAMYSDESSTMTLYLDGRTGNLVSSGNITVTGNITSTDLAATDAATIGGALTVNDNATITGTLQVDGAVTVNNNATITGTLNANGATDLDSTLNVDGASTLAGVTSSGDVTISADSTGGNAGAKNELIGLPRIKLVGLAAGHDGSAETTAYIDSNPTGEWAAVGISVTVSADTTIYRVGSNSLEAAFGISATNTSGISGTIVSDDLGANESIGFWAYATTQVISGDLEIQLTDDDAATPPTSTVGVTITADSWQWVEVDISDCDGGGTDCDAVTEVVLKLTTQGATNLDAFTLYLDGMYKWDADDEEALGAAIQQDGVLSVMSVLTAQDQANTQSVLAEYTDYFVHYESGNDFIVWITDQSARSNVALIAY